MSNRVYGWLPSLPDARDLKADTIGLTIKNEVDPRKHFESVYDQGQLGSCTANAVAAALRYDRILDGKDVGDFSRLAIYYGERAHEHALGKGDTGAFGRDGFKFAQKRGVILEKDWPYDISKFEEVPPAVPNDTYKLEKKYHSVYRSINTFKRVLSNDQTIAFGFSVYESFESEDVAKNGIMPIPDTENEKLLGGHEVLIVGYLEAYPDHFLVRNSWGTEWGLGGYFLMPHEIITNKDFSDDFRTIVRSI